jgi:hypothetical protein
MTRFVPVILLVMLAASRVASAQGTTLPNGADLKFEELQVSDDGVFFEPELTDRPLYFNLPRCTCARAAKDTFKYRLRVTAVTGVNDPAVHFFVGTQCADDELRNTQCKPVTGIGDIDSLFPGGTLHDFNLYQVVNGISDTEPCKKAEGSATIWAMVSTMGSSDDYEYKITQEVGKLSTDSMTSTGVDTRPPPAPDNLSARGSDKGITLSWDPPSSNSTDVYYYQALCANIDDSPVKAAVAAPKFVTTASICTGVAADPSETLTEQPVDNEGTPVAAPSGRFGELGAEHVCGEASGTAEGLTIDGLENNKSYKVVLLAIDLHGNFTGSYLNRTITPVPATDFWEDIHDRGSATEGGFCMVGRSRGNGALTSVLCLLVTAYLMRRRTSRRSLRRACFVRWTALVSGITLILLGTNSAHAGGYQPYWETTDPDDGEQELAPGDPALVGWHAGIRVGPYVPDIDKQFGAPPGPYEQMFGGSRFLPMLDVDRILWTGFGQLGVGISLGYMQKTARSFEDGSDPNDPNRPRAGDENTFRLIPMALTATYRFTQLDDAYGIPVVPYVRGGLAYYVWWLRANGTEVCKAGEMLPDCERNTPRGGSLGFTGSIGIAIRAERVDPSTAMSMQQSGIQHAGIYAELSMAKVDGFGSDTKLSVGDSTWFAGVNFEF